MFRKTDRYDELVDKGEEIRFDFLGPIPTQIPIVCNTAFGFRSVQDYKLAKLHRGPIYGRVPGHPNLVVLEKKYGFVAEADGVMVRADGMAVISQLLWSLSEPGDHIAASLPLYSGTYEFLTNYLAKNGKRLISFFRASDTLTRPVENILLDLIKSLGHLKIIYIESCANPTLDLVDVKRVADFCQERNIILIDDITLMSVFMQNSLNLGADFIVEAITKHLSGGQMMGGVAAWRTENLNRKLRYWNLDINKVIGKMVCLGGTMDYAVAHAYAQYIKTAFIPIKQRNRNAKKVARWLQQKGGCIVRYPGFCSHPQYELARRQMRDEDGNNNFGCMIYFDIGGSEERAYEFATAVASTRDIMLAVSLAAPETIMTHVWTMIFGGISEQERIKLGISPTAFRLSVGLQPTEKICAALEKGFAAIKL